MSLLGCREMRDSRVDKGGKEMMEEWKNGIEEPVLMRGRGKKNAHTVRIGKQ
jgi:hypothetical protein